MDNNNLGHGFCPVVQKETIPDSWCGESMTNKETGNGTQKVFFSIQVYKYKSAQAWKLTLKIEDMTYKIIWTYNAMEYGDETVNLKGLSQFNVRTMRMKG